MIERQGGAIVLISSVNGIESGRVGKGTGRADLVDAMHHWTGLRGPNMLPPQSVSDAVAWITSDGAKNVKGVVLPVDAGHLNLPGFNGDPVRA